MSWNLFFSSINPICLKNSYSSVEYNNIKNNVSPINATTLYNYYKTLTNEPIDYKEFYILLRKYFYFDKYECLHGTEFMYYVKLKNIDIASDIPKDIVSISQAFN